MVELVDDTYRTIDQSWSSLLTTPTGQSTSRGCFTTSLELVDNTYRTVDQSWLFCYKSVNRNPLTPLLRFVVVLWICYIQVVSAVDKTWTDIVGCVVRLW